jgi:hypothetical protein
MAKPSRGARATESERTRRLTAPISDSLFKRVGAFSKYSGRSLGEIAEAAFSAYLSAQRFSIGAAGDANEEVAA